MIVVTDKVRGAAIDGAEQKHHIISIHRVMAEVEEDDGHGLTMAGKQSDKGLDIGGGKAVLEEFFSVLGESVETVEEGEFAPLQAFQNFDIGAGWVAAALCGEQHVGIQYGLQSRDHSELGGDVLMPALKLGE